MNARLIPIIVAAVLAVQAYAQKTGEVRMNIVPEAGARYILDGKYRMNERQVTLTEGDHRFIFWAPEHAILDTTIFVMGNWTTHLNVVLQRPVEYQQYRQELERSRRRQRLARTVPPIVAGGFGVWAAISTIRYGRAHADLQDLRSRYDELSDPGAIRRLKEEEIPEAKDRFSSTRGQTYISTGLFIVSLGAAAYIRRQAARAEPPVYEDRERVRFEGLVWVPGMNGGTWAAGLTIPIR